MGEAKIYILHLFKASTKSSHKSCIMNPYPAYGWANNVPYQGQGVPPQYPAALNNAFLGYALPPFMMELQGKLNESSQERLIAVTKEVNKVRQRLKRSYFKEKLEEVKDYAWRRSTTATDPRAFHAPGEGADLLLDLRSRQPRETRTSFDGTDQKARLPPGIGALDLAFLRHDFRLLQEVVSVYGTMTPPTLTPQRSNRVCSALSLLQVVASHPDTRSGFLNAHLLLFLYPFLQSTVKKKPFEYLRLTSLGVIGALLKTEDPEVIPFLLTTEIIPLCLRNMETGEELSRTVATYILQKILTHEHGLAFACQTYERFSHVALILGKMVHHLVKHPSPRLLKHVIRCYFRLTENTRAKDALGQCLPGPLKDQTFAEQIKDDPSTKRMLANLLKNLEAPPASVTSSQPSANQNSETWRAAPTMQ